MATTLHERLLAVVNSEFPGHHPGASACAPSALAGAEPRDAVDRLISLLTIYDLSTGPLEQIGASARWAGHPAIAEVKLRLEHGWIADLEQAHRPRIDAEDPVRAIRALAAKDRLPRIYRWVGARATLEELREFLAIEGGPDGGFDDLVALCQVGLAGVPKLELARNYWDEMGNGDLGGVHTELYHQMADAIDLPDLPRAALSEPALARAALGGLFATNRWLQPEMIGALGLTELQAGPRCRMVANAFTRLGVPAAAHPFYDVHADVDPQHGKDWLEHVVGPLAAQRPEWGPRMIRGAKWRWQVNAALFDTLEIAAALPSAA